MYVLELSQYSKWHIAYCVQEYIVKTTRRLIALGFHTENKSDISYLKTSQAFNVQSTQELSWQPFSIA